jgi:serine/threonine protein kinase
VAGRLEQGFREVDAAASTKEHQTLATETGQWIGAQLAAGRYTIKSLLGEGGMGLIFRAWDRNLQSEVVIKIPRTPATADRSFTERFLREVHSLVKLAHPHIVRILDIGEHQAVPYAVMQYLPGGSLADRIRSTSGTRVPMPLGALASWLGEIASALDFIHGQQFIHRDVKPANILFDAHGNVYLGDFGVAKALATLAANEQPLELTAGGMLVGTPGYLAPEMILSRTYDGRADQYALAMVVHETLAGSHPFAGLPLSAILVSQATEALPELHEAQPQIPPAVSAAVSKGLAKDPAARFPDCTALAEAVLAAIRAPQAVASQPVTQAMTAVRVPDVPDPGLAPTITDQFQPTPLTGTQAPLVQAPTASPVPSPKGRHLRIGLGLAAGLIAILVWWSFQATPETSLITQDSAITGTVTIDFKTRSEPSNPEAVDTYQVDLTVRVKADAAINYSGTILRRPVSRTAHEGQAFGYLFRLNVSACQFNRDGVPQTDLTRPLGTISGNAFLSQRGLYHFDHLTWTPAVGPAESFQGDVQGRQRAQRAEARRELQFAWEGNAERFVVENPDPLEFLGLRIPGDRGLSPVTLRGDLTFNYATGSYLTDNLAFEYADGRSDHVQGTIIWKTGPECATDGKGQYLFNLVFNGRDAKNPRLRARLFPGEGDLLNVSRSQSSLTGVIAYDDQGTRREVHGESVFTPTKSTATFNLHANRLTRQQLDTFVKMWLLMSGPINDE